MKEISESTSSYDTRREPDAGLTFLHGGEDILAILGKCRSARGFPATRTSPVVNSLTQIWVTTAAKSVLIDINRVHRSLYFDISSSDPVEDYLQLDVGQKTEEAPKASISMIPPKVLSFCTQERILGYLWVMTEIVRKNFQRIDSIEMEVEEDPESAERWVLVSIIVQGIVEEILEEYDHYTEEWVSTVPWPERHKIRLSFDIT